MSRKKTRTLCALVCSDAEGEHIMTEAVPSGIHRRSLAMVAAMQSVARYNATAQSGFVRTLLRIEEYPLGKSHKRALRAAVAKHLCALSGADLARETVPGRGYTTAAAIDAYVRKLTRRFLGKMRK